MIASRTAAKWSFNLFLTFPLSPKLSSTENSDQIAMLQKENMACVHPQQVRFRRFVERDLFQAIGPPAERDKMVAYVCGPPVMTDWTVDTLRRDEGMPTERVLCEKWW